MRKMTKKNKVLAAAGALALVAGGGSAAYAYWTTTGSGGGSATNATINGTVVLHANFADGLTPGGQVDVAYTADNAGTSNLQVNALSPTVTTSDPTHCLASWFEATAVTTNTVVTAGATSTPVGSGTLKFKDSASENQDSCKTAKVTVSVTSN
jgi:hypothetical protein